MILSAPDGPVSESTFQKDSTLWICGFLILSLLLVYGQVLRHEFITYDDPAYITENEYVVEGLTWDGVIWSMTAVVASIWHPLTMLSHMLDVQLFGAHAGLHHFMNVLFHIANALLLFYVLRRMTGAVWKSALVAVLFALHPLRVESVAWASERKDTLSVLFLLLTLIAYHRYVQAPGRGRYLLVAVLFILGLMAKPMLVTLPFALLLLDYWPLCRFQSPKEAAQDLRRLVREKIPLFAISVLGAGASILTQVQTEATGSLELYPLASRMQNAVLSYGLYLRDTVLPLDLVVLYPHPLTGIVLWHVVVSGIVILALTLAALYYWKNLPFAAVGWFWFLGTLVPVIGIIQVGSSSRADRYTYMPHIGLLIVAVWGLAAAVDRWPRIKRPLVGAVAAVVIALMVLSHIQVSYWRNDITLFSRTLEVSPGSSKAHFSLGMGYIIHGDHARGALHFQQCLAINPNNIDARKNLGAALVDLGRPDEAELYLRDIIQVVTNEPEHYLNLAISLFEQAKYDEAIFWAEEALRIDSEYARATELIRQCQRSIPPEIPLD